MKRKPTPTAERCRNRDTSDATYGNNGQFLFTTVDGETDLCCVVSDGEGWDHVSVSTTHRTPTWAELEWIKGIFFRSDETVMQLHVPESDHINLHSYCLHLWRPQDQNIPRPPSWMVA